jgi:autophagy-related protein 101
MCLGSSIRFVFLLFGVLSRPVLPCACSPPRNFERHEFPALELSPSQLKGVLQCVLHSVLFNRALGSFAPKDADCAEFGGGVEIDPHTGQLSNSQLFSVPYAKLDDAHVDGLVDSFLDRFTTALAKTAPVPAAAASSSSDKSGSGGSGSAAASSSNGGATMVREGQVCLGFHEKVVKKKSLLSWGGPSEEKVFWEQWIVPIRCDASSAVAATTPLPASAASASEAASSSSAASAATPSSSSSSSASASSSSSSSSSLASTPLDLARRARLMDCLSFLVFRCNEKREHIPPLKTSSTAALAFSFELSFSVGGKKDDSWSTFTKLLSMTPPMLKLQ